MAMDVLREAGVLAAQGRSIMRLEVGEPGAPPPETARRAAIAALGGGRVGYTDALGLPSLRARIARHYQETYGVAVPAARIAVTTGSSGAFILAFLALFDVGDRVAVAAPGYPAYRNVLEALGCVCVTLETSAATGHVLTADAIIAAHAEAPLKGVLAMSPANPTGKMMTADELRDLAAACARLGVAFLSDEIYHGLTYERPAETALKWSDDAIVINSFSKYYCMTGWRVGWLVLPERFVRPVERLAQSLAISTPYLSQVAAEAAFDARGELETVKAGYAASRAALIAALPAMGLGDFVAPDGAFYVYVQIGAVAGDSRAFCRRLLHDAGVATTPGLDFDRARGTGAVRLSYAGAPAEIDEAIARMARFMRR